MGMYKDIQHADLSKKKGGVKEAVEVVKDEGDMLDPPRDKDELKVSDETERSHQGHSDGGEQRGMLNKLRFHGD